MRPSTGNLQSDLRDGASRGFTIIVLGQNTSFMSKRPGRFLKRDRVIVPGYRLHFMSYARPITFRSDISSDGVEILATHGTWSGLRANGFMWIAQWINTYQRNCGNIIALWRNGKKDSFL
jgi:hypothetical protein